MATKQVSHEYRPSKPPTNSCSLCRSRKLKCDRNMQGCSNCTKAEMPCIYPSSNTSSRNKRGPYNKDKTKRERELEQAIKIMENKFDELANQSQTQTQTENGTDPDSGYSTDIRTHTLSQGNGNLGSAESQLQIAPVATTWTSSRPSAIPRSISLPDQYHPERKGSENSTSPTSAPKQSPPPFEKIHRGRGSLPNSRPSSTVYEPNCQSLLFGPTSSPLFNMDICPTSSQIFELWHIYCLKVDPMTKVLHCPSFGEFVMSARSNFMNLEPEMQTLFFSVFFSSIAASSPSETLERFGEERHTLLTRFKTAIESGLSHGHFLQSPNLVSLQALIIYLLSQEHDCNSNMLWSLTGLATRIAHQLGIPDSEPVNLTPLEVELRRRLWWNIGRLEICCAEENGICTASLSNWSMSKHPSNVNDQDLFPGSTHAPQPRVGNTDMTVFLLVVEAVKLMAQIARTHTRASDSNIGEQLILEKLDLVNRCEARLQEHDLKHCNPSRPYDFMTITFTRLLMTKCRLLAYQPFARGTVTSPTQSKKEEIFLLSLQALRDTHTLKNHPNITRWHWYFERYTHWQALGFVLNEIISRSHYIDIDQTWSILDDVLSDWDARFQRHQDNALYGGINELVNEARNIRTGQSTAPMPIWLSGGSLSSDSSTGSGMTETSQFSNFHPNILNGHTTTLPTPIQGYNMQFGELSDPAEIPDLKFANSSLQPSQIVPMVPEMTDFFGSQVEFNDLLGGPNTNDTAMYGTFT